MSQTRSRASLAALAVGLAGLATAVRAETLDCTPITSLPAVVTVGGVYCLTGDLATADGSLGYRAITIETNNVVLDLNGHKLGGLAAGPGTLAYGIYARNRQNITIKNGTIRGFYWGIFLDGSFPYTSSQGHVIEDIRADQNTTIGLAVYGHASVIRNNQIAATGGTTAIGLDPNTYGIFVEGSAHRVLDNDISTVIKTGAGTSWGIYLAAAEHVMVAGNRITDATRGMDLGGTGKYWNNLTSGVTIAYLGGTNAGNNN